MQFALAALAFIGAAVAQNVTYAPYDVVTSTAWATTEYTVYQCASTVTDCPAESKTVVVVTDTVALYTTICPVTATETPVVYTSEPIYSSQPAPESSPAPYYSATNTPVAPGQPQTYVTYGAPTPTYGAASDTAGTVYTPTATGSASAPIQTGAAIRAGPAFGGLAVAAAVAMML